MALTLCIDFDGVIHSYKSGWKGIDVIPDGPVWDVWGSGFSSIDWLRELVYEKNVDGSYVFDVCIYSSRSKESAGISAMQRWLVENGLSEEEARMMIRYPDQKPAAWLTIDDRAICFEGRFPSVEQIVGFRPWNKKHESDR